MTRKDRRQMAALLAVAGLLVGLAILPLMASAQQAEQQHVVARGETVYSIAARYGVSAEALAAANNLDVDSELRTGAQLVVPAPPGQSGLVHVVKRGENLTSIAEQYGVSLVELSQANNLTDRNFIFAGQRLYVPVTEELTPAPSSTATTARPAPARATPAATQTPAIRAAVTPEATVPLTETITARETLTAAEAMAGCLSGCELISIISPTMGITVTSPVTVTGIGTTVAGRTLVVRVLDGAGQQIGLDYATVDGEPGQSGPYVATVAYTVPSETQPGRIQVYSLDPRDGAVAHLSSVVVTLQGVELDTAVAQLVAALEAKDYAELAPFLADPWVIGFYQSEGLTLDADEALKQLEDSYLGPGDVVVDPSVDVGDLLGEDIIFSPDVQRVVYSTGWGEAQADDAFLLIVRDPGGFVRWGGMLYVYDALRDYVAP